MENITSGSVMSVGLGVCVDREPKGKQNQNANVAELTTDLQLLLECLKCHMDDASVQKDTLLTAAAMCSSSEEAQEYFRECGGINFVLTLLTSTQDSRVKIAALYTLGCACEKNVFSQKRLCTSAVFKFLYCQLVCKGEPSNSLRRTTAFLLLCLVTNNGEGQNLVRTSHCLEVLLKLFKMLCPVASDASDDSPGQRWSTNPKWKSEQVDLWIAVTSTLCGCVNNPQNEKNQAMCASVAFPAAIAIVSKTRNPAVVRLVSSFLSLTIANNVSNQDQFGILGGMDVLVDLLQSIIERLLQQPDQDTAQAAVQLANVFVSCITDSDQNLSKLVDLNLVSMLVQLLSMEVIEFDIKLKVIITLGHLTEKCERSQRQLLESDGLSLLVHIMTENKDEEFNKAAMYVLSNCVDLVSYTEGESANDSANKMYPTKLTGSREKRNKARAERDSRFIPLSDQTGDMEDTHTKDKTVNEKCTGAKPKATTDAVVTSTAGGIVSCRKTDSETLEDQVIEGLLEHLLEEKRARKRLRNEKEALKKRVETREKSKNSSSEAITKELERQCKEQMNNGQSYREEEDSKSTNSNCTQEKQSSLPGMKELEQKINLLEKRLEEVGNLGSQLGGGVIQMSQDKEPVTHRDQSTNTVVRCWKAPIDANKDCHQKDSRLPTGILKQLHDSINTHIKNISSVSKRATSQQSNGSSAPKCTQSSIFKVPTSSLRVSSLRLPQDSHSNKQNMLMVRRKRAASGGKYAELSEECVKHRRRDFDNDSLNSDITDTDISLTASDMNLLKQAHSSYKLSHIDKGHTDKPAQGTSLHNKPRKSFRVDFSSDKGAMCSVSCSRHPSQSNQSTNLPSGADEDSHVTVKDAYTFRESQNNLSGVTLNCSNQSAFHHPKCPGCAPPINRPLLNSRNFLYTLEKNPHTCPQHRKLHRLIKDDIQWRRRMVQTNDTSSSCESTKSTQSHMVRNLKSTRRAKRSPLASTPLGNSSGQNRERTIECPSRRKRQDFTQQEVHNLIEGVAKKGTHWNSILWAYHFAPCRTSVDLKDKYRRLQTQNYPGVIQLSSAKSCRSRKRRWMRRTADPTWRP